MVVLRTAAGIDGTAISEAKVGVEVEADVETEAETESEKEESAEGKAGAKVDGVGDESKYFVEETVVYLAIMS